MSCITDISLIIEAYMILSQHNTVITDHTSRTVCVILHLSLFLSYSIYLSLFDVSIYHHQFICLPMKSHE